LEALMTATSADSATPGTRKDPTRLRRQSLYKGDPGMWAFALHRITGATIFFFLFVHVLDTALVRVSPQAYNEVISTYKTPLVGLMELGLVAAVLFHGLNGVRLILIDFWWQGTRWHRQMLVAVGAIWLVVMVPVMVRIGMHMVERFL
jgi:succinate dehydrogenase / fumarate reductase cytochrome b subunit